MASSSYSMKCPNLSTSSEPKAKDRVVMEGIAEFPGVTVGVIGFDDKFKYFIKSYDEKELRNVGTTPVLMFDFSFSMLPSKKNGYVDSAKPTQEAMETVCTEMFGRGIEKVILIFFGATAHLTEVTSHTYKTVISESLRYYYDDGCEQFNKYSKFQGNATCPEVAMATLLDYVTKNKEPTVYEVIFMTDGGFNGSENTPYTTTWEKLTTQFDKSSHTFRFNSIGYKDDLLKNITDMKAAFDRSRVYDKFSYVTITKPTEIVTTVQKICSEIEEKGDIKVQLADGSFLHLGVPMYSSSLLIDPKSLVETELLRSNYESFGVSREWILDVMAATCHISLRTREMAKEMALVKDVESHQKIFTAMNMFSRNYIEPTHTKLRTTFRSIKARKISIWNEFLETANVFRQLYNRVQDLVSGNLDSKKKFEQQTAISSNLDERHRRNLQRRRAAAECQERKEVDVSMSILNESPLVLEITNFDKKFEVMMDPLVTKKELDDTFSCFFNLERWEASPLICVTAKYLWEANNDWTPSRARIEQVGTAAFISLEGFDEMQKIFGEQKGVAHDVLYKNEGYIKVAHDAANSIVPIATDPTFMAKLQMVKDHLGHMIAGSNYSYATRHINFYIAVIRQCIYQMVQRPTEKLEHITVLLLNTFRLISSKISTVYNEKNEPLPRYDILYNIAIGNTAPRYFTTSWDTSVYALISSDEDFKLANEKYNTETKTELKLNEFKTKLWKMVYRHFIISQFQRDDKWEHPVETWGLRDADAIASDMKELTEVKKLSHEEAVVKVNSQMMSIDKLTTVPKYIQDKISEQIKVNDNVFTLLLNYADRFCDAYWRKFNLNFTSSATGGASRGEFKSFLSDPSLNDLVFWTNWECNMLGYKDCYPLTNQTNLMKQVVGRINSHYGETLRLVIGEAYEYMEFKNRGHETRALPVYFNSAMETAMVRLFADTYNGLIDEKKFCLEVKSILGEGTSKWFDITLKEDGIDVLANLFKYCKGGIRTLDITSRGLPYSRVGNPTSPRFLELLTNEEFSRYYRPVGYGFLSKKYRDWCDDLHPYMLERLKVKDMNEEQFVVDVLEHATIYKVMKKGKDYPEYIRQYYRMFRTT